MEQEKRQHLPGPPGQLQVVATPIGNLGDITPRAREALEKADAILCEDTRRTGTLLAALGVAGVRLERFDAHADDARLAALLERLLEGARFALVSDAGTPGVSDPGARLVALARANGVPVTPLPGASAVVTLLSAAGLDEGPFAFRGFFPRKTGEKRDELDLLAKNRLTRTVVYFESPERIVATSEFIAKTLPAARMAAAKELTKIHEKFFVGEIAAVASGIASEIEREGARGEWCFAVELPSAKIGGNFDDPSEWVKVLHCLLDAGITASRAARGVSQHFGAPKNDAYEEALRILGKKSGRGG